MGRSSDRGPNARKPFNLLLTVDERATLQRAAEAARLPLGTWARVNLLDLAEADEKRIAAALRGRKR